jgi:hypothetical protein
MDRSEAKSIVDREIAGLQEKFGVPHWSLVISFGPLGDNGVARIKGRCTRQVDYNRAHIELDPEELDDEADVLKTLRHELFHVVLAPFDLYSQAADALAPRDSPAESMLDRLWTHALEQAVIALERLHAGLTSDGL